MEKNHEQAEAEQSKNNRGHAGEVENGDTNEANGTCVLAVLVEVNRAANSDRERENHRTDDKQGGADNAGPDPAGGVGYTGRFYFHRMLRFPGTEFLIAQGVFFSFVIENEKGLRPLREERDVNEWRARGEKSAAAFDSDVEKDVGRRCQNGVGSEAKQPERRYLSDAVAGAACFAHRLANRHAITLHQFLRTIIYCQGDGEQNKANHEKCTVMNAASHHLPHLLSNDASHGMHGLEKRAQALREIGNGDPVPSAKQHHHGLADDTAEPKQNGRHDPRKGGWHDHASDCLETIGAQRVGSLLEPAGNIAQGVLGQGENRWHRHKREERTGSEHIQAFRNRKETDPVKKARLRKLPNGFADDGNAEKPEHDRWNSGNEFNVRLD